MRKDGAARSLIEIVKKYYLRIIVIAHHSYWSVKPGLYPQASSYAAINSTHSSSVSGDLSLAVQQNRANFRNLAEGLQGKLVGSRTGSALKD